MRTLLIALVIVSLLVSSIVDLILIDSSRVRALPKWTWVLLVLILPVVGPLLWFTLGRVRMTQVGRIRQRGPKAPDDDTEFLRQLGHDQEQEERIRKLEERLAELDDDDPQP